MAKTTQNNSTMEKLLASLSTKPLALTRGQVVTGEVVAVSEKEAILDLRIKSEGVISLRDFPTGKLPKIGEKIEAFVVEPENDSSQVVLSLQSVQKVIKQSRIGSIPPQQDFNKIAEKYVIDEVYTGTVTKATQFGVFVALEDGVEGLIHTSKVPSGTNYEPGQKIQVSIDSLEAERRRIALSPVITSTKDLIYK